MTENKNEFEKGILLELLDNVLIYSKKSSDLLENLNKLTKPKLLEIGLRYQIGNRKLKKAELIEELINKVESEFINEIVKEDMDLVKSLYNYIENAKKDITILDMTNYLHLYYKGWVFYYGDKGDNEVSILVPDQIKNLISKVLENEDLVQEIKKAQKMAFYIQGLCHLYGVFEKQVLVDIWNKYNTLQISLLDVDHFFEGESKTDICWADGKWIVSGVFADRQGYMQLLSKVLELPYYIPTEEELEIYNQDMIDVKNQDYIELEAFFQNKLEESILDDFLFELGSACVFDATPNEVMELVDEYGIEFAEISELNQFMKLYIKWHNSERKWANRGFTPDELEAKKEIVIQKKDDNKKYSNKKIGRNDPCPCGSGKKYKRCCNN